MGGRQWPGRRADGAEHSLCVAGQSGADDQVLVGRDAAEGESGVAIGRRFIADDGHHERVAGGQLPDDAAALEPLATAGPALRLPHHCAQARLKLRIQLGSRILDAHEVLIVVEQHLAQ